MQYEELILKQSIARNGNGNHHPDELDIVNLTRKMISFVYRFRFILGGFFISGLAFGLYLYFSSTAQYSTRLIVHSTFLSNQEEIEIVENWKNLLGSEKSQLATAMNCNVNVVEKLSNISAEEILKTYAASNTNGFIINVSVTDISVLDQLQAGIIYGLNNSPYVKEKIEVKKSKDRELIKKTTEEIAQLSATKRAVDSLIRNTQANSTPVMLDISRVSAEMIDLNEKLLAYQEDLQFMSGVQVLENFNKGKTVRHGLLKYSFLGMSSGLFIGYLVSLFMFLRLKMKTSDISSTSSV